MLGIDIFSGAGGMALGAKLAGIDVKIAIDNDRHAAETYHKNHPTTDLVVKDIRSVESLSVKKGKQSLILFGGPPCQGFSTSNQKTRNSSNSLNWLYLEFLRITNMLNPEWVVFENVIGITETEKGLFLDRVKNKLTAMNYEISSWILNAVDYGVPQKRQRLFVVGSYRGKAIQKPTPNTNIAVTVEEAIFDLPELENGAAINNLPYRPVPMSDYAKKMRKEQASSENHLVTKNSEKVIERYKYIPEGGNWESIPAELMSNYRDFSRCHTGIYYRLKYDSPSVVIGNYRKNMLVHPKQHRGLSVREAARLQSFPDEYVFVGSIGFQQQQVGNAVPPLMAEAVFRNILNS